MPTKAYARVHEERNSVQSFFQEKWAEAEENKRFARMLQYSSDQLNKFTAANRVPYVLDFITQPLNTYIGDQRDSRTDIKYLPVEAGDEVRAELLNAVKDVILRRNRWMWLESDIFMDGIISKAGCVGYEWSTEKHPLGSLNMFRVPIRQLTWDINRREFDLEVSSWVSRTRLYSKRHLLAMKPEFTDVIETMSLNGSELDDLKLDPSYFKTIIDTDLSAVALIEFYERKYRQRFFISPGRGQQPLPQVFESNAKAVEAIEQMKEKAFRDSQYGASGDSSDAAPPPDFDSFDIIKKMLPVVLKTEVASNVDFTVEEEQEMPFYPYDVYYPFWMDGEYWSVLDYYKDPQRFINKAFSIVDHQMSTGSGSSIFLGEDVPEEMAAEIVANWGKVAKAYRGVPNPKENIVVVAPTGFDMKLLEVMQAAMLNIEKKAGGANNLGRRESSAESGVAVEKRQQRASIASFMIYDNLDRWKLSVGEKIAWYISNMMTAQQKIRIEGEQLTEFAKKNFPSWLYEPSQMNQNIGFMEINSNAQNTMDDLHIDIIVDQSAHAATKNKETLGLIQQMMNASQEFASMMPPQLLISLFDLPASLKQEMMQEAEKLLQMKQEQAKAEANKPPTLSANMKDVTILPPPLQAQFLALFGLQMQDGEMVVDPEAEESRKEKGIKIMNAVADREFKREKHEDQMSLRMGDMIERADIEGERIKVQREKAKSNGGSK